MAALSDLREFSARGWQVYARSELWEAPLREQVLTIVRAQAPARHPQTIQLSGAANDAERRYYLKVFHRMSLGAALKDQFRASHAFNSWRQGKALATAGFNAPRAVAVGRESGWRIARREFILTEAIAGVPLKGYLGGHHAAGAAPWRAKREMIISLARLLRRFHDAGFVHGDLVANNLFVAAQGTQGGEFCFMDNDRTRQYPTWLGQPFWKRNLIQLNRMPLPGISLQDRMRFLHAYLGVARLSRADRRFARWLEARTRQRRMECDGADPTESFRRLMRWPSEMGEQNMARNSP